MLGSHASKDEIAYLKAKAIKEIVQSSKTKEEAIARATQFHPEAGPLAAMMVDFQKLK